MTPMTRRFLLALSLLAAALAAACAPTQVAAPVYTLDKPAEEEKPVAAAPMPEIYEVKKGDTLIGIAMHYDLDHLEVARWNNLRDPNLIQPGQRLRLSRPENDPVVGVVPKRQTAALQPVQPAGAQSAPAAQPAQPAQAAAQPAQPVQRERTVVGGSRPASPAAVGTVPYKNEPQAIKYAYSKSALGKLRRQWQQQQAAQSAGKPAAASQPAPAPTATAVPAPAPAAAKSAASAPARTRQKYGVQWSLPSTGAVLKGYSSQSKGVDFSGKKGDPVYAAADGEVIYVGTGVKSYGRLVILRHDNNYLSAYAHNDSIVVKEGQRIARGAKIATMGDSSSDRVMLHFEVRKGGKPLDPMLVLPQ